MIFEKFYRAEPSNTGRYKGFGVGLHEVKRNIDEMQGELDLYSEEGQGATFICTLPFKLPLVEE